MNKIQRKALYQELINYCLTLDEDTYQEAVFNTFLDTKRRFRADVLLPNKKTIVEVNGGQFSGGRHNRGGRGYETDLFKLNLASSKGYKVLQFTYEMLVREEYKLFL